VSSAAAAVAADRAAPAAAVIASSTDAVLPGLGALVDVGDRAAQREVLGRAATLRPGSGP
jgi:hypothetical protein